MRKSIVVVLAAALIGSAGCDSTGAPSFDDPFATDSPATAPPPGAGAPGGAAPSASQRAAAQARADLATIPVRTIPGRDPSYEREKFGDAWSDAGIGIASARNGCDTRNDVLKRDAKPGTVRLKAGTNGCKVIGGTWVSPYTGATFTVPRRLDIDHTVPLARAWSAGAKSWPAQRRLNFANDPDNLRAVDASSNRSKSDLGPSAWRPKRPFQCSYAIVYIRATKKYQLPLSKPDVAALRDMLTACR
jgi:hypothetical protein